MTSFGGRFRATEPDAPRGHPAAGRSAARRSILPDVVPRGHVGTRSSTCRGPPSKPGGAVTAGLPAAVSAPSSRFSRCSSASRPASSDTAGPVRRSAVVPSAAFFEDPPGVARCAGVSRNLLRQLDQPLREARDAVALRGRRGSDTVDH